MTGTDEQPQTKQQAIPPSSEPSSPEREALERATVALCKFHYGKEMSDLPPIHQRELRRAVEVVAAALTPRAVELPPLIDRGELIKLLEDLASVNLTREACERQARRMADDLIARGLGPTPRAVEKAGEPIDPADLWEEYLDQLEHEPSAQGALAFAVERLTATPSGADVRELEEWKQAASVEAGLRREFLARAEKAEAALASGADVRAALEEARVYLLKYTAGFALKERALLAKIDAALSRPDRGVGS